MGVFHVFKIVQTVPNRAMHHKCLNRRVELFLHQTICLKRVEKKTLLGRHNKDMRFTPLQNSYLIIFKNMQKQPPEFYKKAALKNFAIFTRKHLCWRLFLIQNIAKFLEAPILIEHLKETVSENVFMKRKFKTFH